MKMILLKSVAVAVNLFAIYVIVLAAYLILEFIRSQPTVEINGNGLVICEESERKPKI